jgi:hypothetical protein
VGNKQAFSTFQRTIITLYNHNVLTRDLLDDLAEEWKGTDIDSRGYNPELVASDGKSLQEICVLFIYPREYWMMTRKEEQTEKWYEITEKRWGWC